MDVERSGRKLIGRYEPLHGALLRLDAHESRRLERVTRASRRGGRSAVATADERALHEGLIARSPLWVEACGGSTSQESFAGSIESLVVGGRMGTLHVDDFSDPRPPVDTQSAWIHAVAIERWPRLSTKLADSIARTAAPTLPRFPVTGLDPEGLLPETIGLDSAR